MHNDKEHTRRKPEAGNIARFHLRVWRKGDLLSDNAKVQTRKAIQNIIRLYCIADLD